MFAINIGFTFNAKILWNNWWDPLIEGSGTPTQ